jgi:uncharacterized protein (DUF1015 family)
MSMIKPFAGLRPVAAHAADVVAPPYDVLSSAEARQQAAGRPWSFLHISKPEIDLPAGIDPHDPAVYAKGAENLARLREAGILQQDPRPMYYLYRLEMGEHSQTGLVATASVADYDSNRIRKHEFTRPDKEDDRVRHIEALNAQTGPVFLTYRHNDEVDALGRRIMQSPPLYDLTAEDGVRHTLWLISDQADIDSLTRIFDAMDKLYIADGHHRSAAASRVAARRRAAGRGDNPADYFLVVLFPDTQMNILDYNRVVADLNGLGPEALLDAVGEAFTVEASAVPVRPRQSGEFGLYLPGQWYRLQIGPERIPKDDPVARLDVSLLQDNLIAPILGIEDPRRDRRIDFVGGIRGLQELERRVDSGEMQAAFSLYPTRMADLMAVADAGEVMPPKSTWFEPKLADGLVSHLLEKRDE